jgi:hypothetical protein
MATVTQNGKYNNIQLNSFKATPGMATGEKITMLKTGKFPVSKLIEKPKTTLDGRAYTMKMWMCSALYEGQEVSFFLWNEDEAKEFDEVAGPGDAFTVEMTDLVVTNKKGQRIIKEHLVFAPVLA